MFLLKITVFVCVCFFKITAALTNACTTPDNQRGQCILFEQCPELYSLLEKLTNETITLLRKSRCDTDGGIINLKICCPVLLQNQNTTTNFSTPLLSKKNQCGVLNDDKKIEGKTVDLFYHPWTVLLKYEKENKFRFHCAGSLLNDRYVLTAAHCISKEYLPENTTLVSVHLGEHNLETNPDCETVAEFTYCNDPLVEVPIEEIIVHEGYSKQKSDSVVENDIAVLRLKTKVNITDFIIPIYLPVNEEELKRKYGGVVLRSTGWDINSTNVANSIKITNDLLGKSHEECNEKFNLTLTENQFCAIKNCSYRKCSSDSGGAVVFENAEGYYIMAGIEAWHGPCEEEQVTIYNTIAGYRKWIIDHMLE